MSILWMEHETGTTAQREMCTEYNARWKSPEVMISGEPQSDYLGGRNVDLKPWRSRWEDVAC